LAILNYNIKMKSSYFKRKHYYLLLFFISVSFYGQNTTQGDISLTILKDSIENNSLVTVEFFNHSDTDYYLPLDTSMDRHLGFNSYYDKRGDFSLNEVWYDSSMGLGNYRGTGMTDCMDVKQSSFSFKTKKEEENFKNVDILLMESNTSVRIKVAIQFIKNDIYSCSLYYQSTDNLFANFQLSYQVEKEKMEQLRHGNEFYGRKNLEDDGYQLYTKKIESNIVPLKISKEMKEFMKEPYYGKAFLVSR